MDLNKLREEVNGKQPEPQKEPEPQPKLVRQSTRTFTQQDVDEITFTAIKNYDLIKKARKIEKQDKQKKEREIQDEKNRLLNIVNRHTPQNNIWSDCF